MMRARGRTVILIASVAMAAVPAVAAPALFAVGVAGGAPFEAVEADRPRNPASLTKLMTAYLAFEAMAQGRARPADVVVVSERAAGQGGAVLGLAAGERITLGRAVEAMIVRSANDAAVAVAEHLAGGEAAFAERMSATAARLGMTSSHFRNATGFTAPGHHSTPRDMATLALALLRDFPGQAGLFARRTVERGGRQLPSVNGFLSAYGGAAGMKTGFTCPAGYNLVALAERGGHRAVVVVMGAASAAERAAFAGAAMNRALKGEARPAAHATTPAAFSPTPPDLSALACGGRGGGAPPGVALPPRPSGWALEVAFGLDPHAVLAATARIHRELGARLGGGRDVTVMVPRDGMVRHRGLIAGLDERRAVDTCLAERARAGEERCTVLTPAMLDGALEEEQRYQRIVAR